VVTVVERETRRLINIRGFTFMRYVNLRWHWHWRWSASQSCAIIFVLTENMQAIGCDRCSAGRTDRPSKTVIGVHQWVCQCTITRLYVYRLWFDRHTDRQLLTVILYSMSKRVIAVPYWSGNARTLHADGTPTENARLWNTFWRFHTYSWWVGCIILFTAVNRCLVRRPTSPPDRALYVCMHQCTSRQTELYFVIDLCFPAQLICPHEKVNAFTVVHGNDGTELLRTWLTGASTSRRLLCLAATGCLPAGMPKQRERWKCTAENIRKARVIAHNIVMQTGDAYYKNF